MRKLESRKVFWSGIIQPNPLFDTYEIEIKYEIGSRASIKVISSDLQPAPGAKNLPHTYEGNYLYLYYPIKHKTYSVGGS